MIIPDGTRLKIFLDGSQKDILNYLKIGFEGIAKLHYHEMEQQCNELLKEEDEKTLFFIRHCYYLRTSRQRKV